MVVNLLQKILTDLHASLFYISPATVTHLSTSTVHGKIPEFRGALLPPCRKLVFWYAYFLCKFQMIFDGRKAAARQPQDAYTTDIQFRTLSGCGRCQSIFGFLLLRPHCSHTNTLQQPCVFMQVKHKSKGKGKTSADAAAWLAWLAQSYACSNGDLEVAGSIPVWSDNILLSRSIMNLKYFLLSFSPFRWFKKGSCQFLVKECAQELVNRLED